MRREIDPAEAGAGDFYKVLTAVVVPRPIAWVATRSADGADNLAPHSFFTVACVDPPIVQFTSVGEKDSLRNVRATREFTISLAPEPLFEQINATGTNFPHGVSELEQVGLAAEPSARVAPVRVAQSPVVLECVLERDVTLGNSTVVLGRVVLAAIDEAVFADDGLPDVERLRPLARLGREEWSTLGEVREISRIPYDDWPGHYG